MKAGNGVFFGTLRIFTQYGTKVYEKSIIKSIRLNIDIRISLFVNLEAPLENYFENGDKK